MAVAAPAVHHPSRDDLVWNSARQDRDPGGADSSARVRSADENGYRGTSDRGIGAFALRSPPVEVHHRWIRIRHRPTHPRIPAEGPDRRNGVFGHGLWPPRTLWISRGVRCRYSPWSDDGRLDCPVHSIRQHRTFSGWGYKRTDVNILGRCVRNILTAAER